MSQQIFYSYFIQTIIYTYTYLRARQRQCNTIESVSCQNADNEVNTLIAYHNATNIYFIAKSVNIVLIKSGKHPPSLNFKALFVVFQGFFTCCFTGLDVDISFATNARSRKCVTRDQRNKMRLEWPRVQRIDRV